MTDQLKRRANSRTVTSINSSLPGKQRRTYIRLEWQPCSDSWNLNPPLASVLVVPASVDNDVGV